MDIVKLLKKAARKLWVTPKSLGRQGEEQTASKLGWVSIWGYKGKLLRNVYVPMGNGGTTEIDLLYITQKGIFVLESKNYAGYIYGNEWSQNWMETLYAGKTWLGRNKVEKHRFYNPIWQNRTHMRALERYLGSPVQMISVIVFSERCTLREITYDSPDVVVCHQDELLKNIRRMWRTLPDTLSWAQIDQIHSALRPLTDPDRATKRQHVQDIKEYKSAPSYTCPWCGGELVLRTAKNGPHAGQQFYGCANYPQCRYIRDL